MNSNELERFQVAADDARVLFFFTGELTASTVAVLGAALRRRLDERDVRGPPGRKIFSSFVEMAQNVLHYASAGAGPGPEPARRGTIVIGTGDDHHWIASSNDVDAGLVPRLRDRLERIARMSAAELKEAYQRQLNDESHEASDPLSRGAGLGLLTIARASRSPLEHSFAPVLGAGGARVRFHLCARLDRLAPAKEG